MRATHDFLVEGDIEFYRPFVRENCEKLPLLLHYEGDEIVAFLGYDMTSIEMLFVDPDYLGKGHRFSDLIEWGDRGCSRGDGGRERAKRAGRELLCPDGV